MKKRKSVLLECERRLLAFKDQYTISINRPSDNKKEGADVLDMAARDQEIKSSMFFRSKIKTTLNEINLALQKIEFGQYGICEISGEEIENNRLLAIPWARYSLQVLEDNEAS